MDKTIDQELLELQELALTHKVVNGRKSIAEKQMILKAHLVNHVPISHLSREFGVDKATIYRWIRTFASGNVPAGSSNGVPNVKPDPSIMPRKNHEAVESASEELARLREENKRLSEALRMAEWMNHAKDVMIEEAEKMFNIPIRKKAGAKQ